MKYHKHHTPLNQRAFTIIELLIATAILSTILVMVTVMMVSIGNLYYKGVNQGRVQDDVRSISDEVAQHLQLSDSAPLTAISPDGKTQAYCFGPIRYTYKLNTQIGSQSTQTPHVLWRDDNLTPSSCTTTDTFLANPPTNTHGTELIAPNSRLTAFSISTALPSPYTVVVGVAYGDTDLLTQNGINTVCNGHTGDQFCATANLTTTVTQQLVK